MSNDTTTTTGIGSWPAPYWADQVGDFEFIITEEGMPWRTVQLTIADRDGWTISMFAMQVYDGSVVHTRPANVSVDIAEDVLPPAQAAELAEDIRRAGIYAGAVNAEQRDRTSQDGRADR